MAVKDQRASVAVRPPLAQIYLEMRDFFFVFDGELRAALRQDYQQIAPSVLIYQILDPGRF